MKHTEAPEKIIDVKRVIANKNPKLLQAMPGFLIRFIQKIIHEDEINRIITKNRAYYGIDFVNRTLEEFGITYQSRGTENIPGQGRFIIVSNHPLGGMDGMVLISCMGQYFSDIKFIVNDLLLNLENLAPVFTPVNTLGKQNMDYVKKIDQTYQSDTQVLNFPAGICSRKVGGQIIDLEWKKSFITKAIQYKRDIIPVYFNGRNSSFFYNLAYLRKLIGIKANIEMFFLPHEMFKQKNTTLQLNIGKPISYQTFDKRRSRKEWAQKMKEHVYQLHNDPYRDFQFE